MPRNNFLKFLRLVYFFCKFSLGWRFKTGYHFLFVGGGGGVISLNAFFLSLTIPNKSMISFFFNRVSSTVLSG